jgi:hypothetical protein
MQSARTTERPRKRAFARNQARGVPNTNAIAVAMSEVRNDNFNAEREVSSLTAAHRFDQGARHATATNGSTTMTNAGNAAMPSARGDESRRVTEA